MEVKGFGSDVEGNGLHGLGGETSWRKQGPGERRDPRKTQTSCSGWGQQWATLQAGPRPLKLRENALGATGTDTGGGRAPTVRKRSGFSVWRKAPAFPGSWRVAEGSCDRGGLPPLPYPGCFQLSLQSRVL